MVEPSKTFKSPLSSGRPTEVQGGALVAKKSHGGAEFAPFLSRVLKGAIKAHLMECVDLRPPEIASRHHSFGKLHD
ncbi:unnamed protein product [Prunus armeniaca]